MWDHLTSTLSHLWYDWHKWNPKQTERQLFVCCCGFNVRCYLFTTGNPRTAHACAATSHQSPCDGLFQLTPLPLQRWFPSTRWMSGCTTEKTKKTHSCNGYMFRLLFLESRKTALRVIRTGFKASHQIMWCFLPLFSEARTQSERPIVRAKQITFSETFLTQETRPKTRENRRLLLCFCLRVIADVCIEHTTEHNLPQISNQYCFRNMRHAWIIIIEAHCPLIYAYAYMCILQLLHHFSTFLQQWKQVIKFNMTEWPKTGQGICLTWHTFSHMYSNHQLDCEMLCCTMTQIIV